MENFPHRLLEGYTNFMDGRYAMEQERYHELATEGQAPETLIIGCCDSRATPETIFDCGPGEVFVLRNVANLVPPFENDDAQHGTSAGIEFAVLGLKVKNIVVMGHGRCGGIHAALNPATTDLPPGNFIGKWLTLLDPVKEQFGDNKLMTDRERETAFERISIRNSISNLRTFPYIADMERKNEINLYGAWFDIKTGELWVMDNETGEFERPDI